MASGRHLELLVIVEMIRQGLIAVADADVLLAEWAGKHRFKLKIASFADVM